MMKKVLSLMLIALMSLQLGTTVFAATPKHTDAVETTATMQIAKNVEAGIAEITAETGDSVTVKKSESAPFPTFDYLCTLEMANVRDKFNYYYEALDNINSYVDTNLDEYYDKVTGKTEGTERDDYVSSLKGRLENMKIKGEFTIEIAYSNDLKVPDEFFVSGNMTGFDEKTKLIFGNDVRSTPVKGANETTFTIKVEVVGEESEGRPGYVLAKDLKDNIANYLSDLTLACEGVESTKTGTFTVTGRMTGFTLIKENIAEDAVLLKVDYSTSEDATATCTIETSGGSAGSGSFGRTEYTISFDVDGDKDLIKSIDKNKNTKLTVSELPIPHKDGYVFNGWYTDKTLQNKLTEDILVTYSMVLYGSFVPSDTADILNDGDHFAYIVGYPEGDVRPNNPITREEIATVFFRLLDEDARASLLTETNSFSDVNADRWSNTAISTMENGKFITGYTDGTFAPAKFITRAEFAAIASRLDTPSGATVHGFNDISGHWSEAYVADAVAKGWIEGYGDGTFKPEKNITRAEAMTIINRMLNRFVNAEGLHKDAILWPDNEKDAWYYYAVEEATNSHEFERQADGVYETWTAITPNRDWLEYER